MYHISLLYINNSLALVINCILSCFAAGHIRLRSSSDSNSSIATSGQLEMYWSGEWAAVCNYPYFSRNNAQVACRQLGFEKVINYGGSLGSLGYENAKSVQ